MFTGLIETTGTVLSLSPAAGGAMRLIVAAPALAGRWETGDSIAVNGTCLTAIPVQDAGNEHPGRFAADLAEETIRRTTLTRLVPGSLVNLELPTPSGAPMGGHVVQGHVDGVGTLIALEALNADLDRTDWRMTVQAPPALAPSIVQQGSITIDGISLTVAKLHPTAADGSARLEIAVIPHTYKSTNLRSLLSGAEVNLETDVLARYAARQAEFAAVQAPMIDYTLQPAAPRPGGLTIASLIARGY
ncbi:riboflavin synthase [Granulicella cerasi]|uniref:Riboflavin synthase n=1 Tax=Granulicella cerasi TaxID=741063 RepID=A0ABW1Z7Z5_9BACT|nr:riboflavin synthase [Granulicella cerasi]